MKGLISILSVLLPILAGAIFIYNFLWVRTMKARRMFRNLSSQIGGNLIKGRFLQSDEIHLKREERHIIIDIAQLGDIPCTRMRMPYVSRHGFRFSIQHRRTIKGIGKLAGIPQAVKVGYAYLDDEFVTKTNDEPRIKKLFANSRIRQLISSRPPARLQLKDSEGRFGPHIPDIIDELCVEGIGITNDATLIENWLDLLDEIHNQLENL